MRTVARGSHDFLSKFLYVFLRAMDRKVAIFFFLTMAIGIKSSKVAKFMNSVNSDCQLHPLIAGHKKFSPYTYRYRPQIFHPLTSFLTPSNLIRAHSLFSVVSPFVIEQLNAKEWGRRHHSYGPCPSMLGPSEHTVEMLSTSHCHPHTWTARDAGITDFITTNASSRLWSLQ